MASRALAFSDPAVIEWVSREFVPVAENCSYLQWQQDVKGEFFRHVAEQGHYGGRTQPSATRQGIYACTADGRFLASINTRQAEPLLGMVQEALRRWREAPDEVGPFGPPDPYVPDARLPAEAPPNGLVLNVYARDLARPHDSRPHDMRRDAVNLDHAWLTREEAGALLPADPVVGARLPVPAAVVRRLARFHLLDNVRGETPMWREAEVQHAAMSLTVTAVRPERLELRLEGAVRSVARGTWAVRPFDERLLEAERGYDCRLHGFLEYDRALGRFARFDVLAVGLRWGGSEHNVRWDDLEPAPMAVAFELAGNGAWDRIRPQGVRAEYWGAGGA